MEEGHVMIYSGKRMDPEEGVLGSSWTKRQPNLSCDATPSAPE